VRRDFVDVPAGPYAHLVGKSAGYNLLWRRLNEAKKLDAELSENDTRNIGDPCIGIDQDMTIQDEWAVPSINGAMERTHEEFLIVRDIASPQLLGRSLLRLKPKFGFDEIASFEVDEGRVDTDLAEQGRFADSRQPHQRNHAIFR